MSAIVVSDTPVLLGSPASLVSLVFPAAVFAVAAAAGDAIASVVVGMC